MTFEETLSVAEVIHLNSKTSKQLSQEQESQYVLKVFRWLMTLTFPFCYALFLIYSSEVK